MIIKRFNIIKERFKLYKKEIEKINNNKYISFFNKTKKIFNNVLFLKFLTKNKNIDNDINLLEKKIFQFFYFWTSTISLTMILISGLITLEKMPVYKALLLLVSTIWLLMIFSNIIINILHSNAFYKKMIIKNSTKLTKKEVETFIKKKTIAQCFDDILKVSTNIEILKVDKEIVEICQNPENNINSNYFYIYYLKKSLLEAYKNKEIGFDDLIKKVNFYIENLSLDKFEVSEINSFVEEEKQYLDKIQNLKNIENNLLNSGINKKELINF